MSSVAEFWDLLQGAKGGSKLQVFAQACAVSALLRNSLPHLI